jgi:hypothetical protein
MSSQFEHQSINKMECYVQSINFDNILAEVRDSLEFCTFYQFVDVKNYNCASGFCLINHLTTCVATPRTATTAETNQNNDRVKKFNKLR